MFSNKNRNVFFVLSAFAIAFTFWFYGNVIQSPNSWLFTDKGDGIKNYFTYAWHIKNDTSYVNFQGMNYPYGEHFLYTDCHPLFTLILKSASAVFPSIADKGVGILNFLMLCSFFLTCVLLYFIFLEFKVNRILSALGAFGISMLSPQIFRMTGHLALSYSFFIPITWYLLLRYINTENKLKWSLFLLLNNIFWFYIHAYLGMMLVFFNFCYLIIPFLSQIKKSVKSAEYYKAFIIQILLPVLSFRIFLILTDTHYYRTINPLGFFLYNAELDDIFVPHHPPLRPFLDKLADINLQWEAWGYVGLTSVFILLFIIAGFVKSIIKKKRLDFRLSYFPDRRLNIALLSSVVLLLFAFGIPFKQYPPLLDYFSIIKNFRGTGRFDWFFYFVFTVFSVFTMNNIANRLFQNGKKIAAFFLIIAGPVLFVVEGISYHTEVSKLLNTTPNLFDKAQLEKSYTDVLAKIPPNKFQALISIPFYYIGSESYDRPPQNNIEKYSFVVAYHSKIPLCASHLTRTGIFESKNIVQLISPDFYNKPICKSLPGNKPFLIIKSNETLSDYEKDLLQKCTLIFESREVSLYEIFPDKLFNSSAKNEIHKFDSLKAGYLSCQGFYTKDTASFLFYNDFEKNPAKNAFRENGAYVGDKPGKNTFASFSAGTFQMEKEYVVSAWMFNNQLDAINDWFRFIVEEYDQKTGNYISTTCFPSESEVINGNWSLVELSFKIQNPQNGVSIVSIGKEGINNKIYLDDLLIREKSNNVYKIIKEERGQIHELFKNNHSIIVQ